MAKFTPNTKEELQALVKDEAIHLGDIDTSNITDMSELFLYSKREDFSGIETWDTSNVENMFSMFEGCKTFNQDISGWDVSNVENMAYMFSDCKTFNQDISSWEVSKIEYTYNMFENCPIDNSNKPKELQELFYDNMNLEEVEIILSKLPKDLVFQALYKQEIMYKIDNDENEYEVDEKIINKSVKELYNKYIDDFSDTPMLNEHWLDELVEITDEIAEEQAEQKDKIKNKKGLK
ncbi:BspA family leucine-rich repeat surface protein [Campylobacter jejuni]|uniref:BspA family leucine-rich repeat surface protein n=1 Tax=Campylobacter jejuni TaxID=197 RepID=UPI003B9C5B7C